MRMDAAQNGWAITPNRQDWSPLGCINNPPAKPSLRVPSDTVGIMHYREFELGDKGAQQATSFLLLMGSKISGCDQGDITVALRCVLFASSASALSD